MAPIKFLVPLYPGYDSLFCECIPGGPNCIKCSEKVNCSKYNDSQRGCRHGQER